MTASEKKCPDCGRELRVETLSWRRYRDCDCDYCRAYGVGGMTTQDKGDTEFEHCHCFANEPKREGEI